MGNLCVGLEFTKVPFTVLDIAFRTAWPVLDRFNAVVVCTEKIWQLPEDKTSALDAYVRGGGGLMIAYRGWHEDLAELLGMGQMAGEPEMHTTSGLEFDEDLFPGLSGLKISDDDWLFDHSRFDIERNDLAPAARILATDTAGRPIAWWLTCGDGRVCYWNTSVLFCRALRGFVLQSVLSAMGTGVAAIPGFAMFQVDDFPPSLSTAVDPPVSDEFPGTDRDGFFFDVWHGDMMKLREKHGLRYTWYVVANYSDIETDADTDPDSHAARSGREVLEARMRRAPTLAEGDEYGFHGYNHEPLTSTGWPDIEVLRRKLRSARELWATCISGEMPVSWVPANNWYHPEHVRVLKEVFPEIRLVCGLFSVGDYDLGEYREFGAEPWEPGLTCIPRESYGYVELPELRMMILSQISGSGIWSHFVHPDDVYDVPPESGATSYHRNQKRLNWSTPNKHGERGMFDQLDDLITRLRQTYPWLEFSTASEAGSRYRRHVDNTVSIGISHSRVEIESGDKSLFYVRSPVDTELVPLDGGRLLDSRTVEGGTLHVVSCKAGHASFDIAARIS